MKSFEIQNLNYTLQDTDLANLFNIYLDSTMSNNTLQFSINRTLNLTGLNNISKKYFIEYTTIDGDTWALISYKNYDTTRLWWLICKLNNINNPLVDPEVNIKLKILDKSFIAFIEDTLKNS